MLLMLAVLTLAAAEPPAASAADDPPTDASGLQQMYDQSCAAREYGAYDDLCDQLSQQLKAIRVQADREARRRAAGARRHPRPTPAPSATSAVRTEPAASSTPPP